MNNKHPDIDLLVEYATGSLPLAPSIAITTHLQFCDHCREFVASLQDLGGEMLNDLDQVSVSDELLDHVLECIDSSASKPTPARVEPKQCDEISSSLPGYVRNLLPEGDLEWRFLSPSLRVASLPVGELENELALHRIKAGGKAPEHDHRGREFTVVLTGSFSDEDGVYQPGDFIVREPGDVHRPLAAKHEECICLSVLAAPIKLTGMKSVLNPFLGFNPA